MAEVLNATAREALGTRGSRRLRRSGLIPAVLYGHGQEAVNLSVPTGEVQAAIRHGSKLVDVKGAVNESALIREVQWDPFGVEVLHLDLARVSAEEAVEVVVAVELVGEAPGIREGGVVEHTTHELEIICRAAAIPDKFDVKVNSLHLGQSITAADIALPDGAKLVTDPETIIVSCVEPAVTVEEEVVAAAGEPEVIGRKAEEEEKEESED